MADYVVWAKYEATSRVLRCEAANLPAGAARVAPEPRAPTPGLPRLPSYVGGTVGVPDAIDRQGAVAFEKLWTVSFLQRGIDDMHLFRIY